VTKDRLYCDGLNDEHRRSSQSAMAMITKTMLTLIAPILTYTADEIVEVAPAVIKGDKKDIFEYVYEPLKKVELNFNEEYMIKARDAFSEIVDSLKKEKKIKSTLELNIVTNSEILSNIDSLEVEDWFVISTISSDDTVEELANFKVDGDEFIITLATKAKCPRCWKFHAEKEDSTCSRCGDVLSA
jgi:isoleucyl-tRNA synthetase